MQDNLHGAHASSRLLIGHDTQVGTIIAAGGTPAISRPNHSDFKLNQSAAVITIHSRNHLPRYLASANSPANCQLLALL